MLDAVDLAPPRVSWRAVPMWLFYVAAAPAAVGGGLALAPLQAIVGLVTAPWEKIARLPYSLGLSGWALLTFIAWALVTLAWSPSGHASVQALKLAGGVLCGIGFVAAAQSANEPTRRKLQLAGVAFAVALSVLIMIEALGHLPLNSLFQPGARADLLARNPGKGVCILICWMWPAIATLAGGSAIDRAIWRALLGVALIGSFLFMMAANEAAFALALAAYVLAYITPGKAPLAIFGSAAVWLLSFPWIVPFFQNSVLLTAGKESWRIREQIWLAAAQKISERPLFGWGFDSARTMTSIMPLHPHSASMQIWLETGVVGAVLAAATLFIAGWSLSRRLRDAPLASAATCASAAAIGLFWNASFGLWQEWLVATAFGAAALVAALMPIGAGQPAG